jgi:hypothetical protein
MNKNTMTTSCSLRSLFFAVLCLIALPACTRDEQTIEGAVVDESNAPVPGATVTACYSGWGWSNGQLVWDKVFCSDPVVSNNEGKYAIIFKNADFVRLNAKKEGWTQAKDFNSNDVKIILIPTKAHMERVAREAHARDEESRKRLESETDADYYCRVLVPHSSSVNLKYQKQTLTVVTSFLLSDSQPSAIFGVRASPLSANAFASEAQLEIHGRKFNTHLSHQTKTKSCAPDFHLIESKLDNFNMDSVQTLEVYLPSISSMFELQKWTTPTNK